MNGLIPRDDLVLLVVDIQEKLFPAIAEKEKMLASSIKVIDFCRRLNIPIIITEQYPKGLGSTLPKVQQALGNDYKPIPKTAFSLFGEPEFVKALKATGKTWLALIGIESHVCVAQTALAALNYHIDDPDGIGYQVAVLEDCIGSRAIDFHLNGIDRMKSEGAVITTSDAFYYEMLVKAKTDDHKKVFDLLK